MDREELGERVKLALGVAKENLVSDGEVLPILMMYSEERKMTISPVPDKNLVPHILEKEKPFAFVYVAEMWTRGFHPEEERILEGAGGAAELTRLVRHGEVPLASQDPNRREAIGIFGGSGKARMMMTQPFHKEDGKVVFDGGPEMSDVEPGQSMVDWPERAVEMNLALPAPPGGRIVTLPGLSVRMWIPENWKVSSERDVEGDEVPVFYREKGSNGALRITTVIIKPEALARVGGAKQLAEDRYRELGKAGVENLRIEDKKGRMTLSWSQILDEPGQKSLTKTHGWAVYSDKGIVLLTFSHSAEVPQERLKQELDSLAEIADRITQV